MLRGTIQTTSTITVLVVDSDVETADMVQEFLHNTLGCQALVATTANAAMQFADSHPEAIVLSEADLPDSDGIVFLEELRHRHPDRRCMLMTTETHVSQAVAAMRAGAMDLFVKPFDLGQLAQAIRRAGTQQQRTDQLARRHQRLRATTKRVIRQRRDLRRKVDLLCNDVVGAYRDLASKVLAIEHSEGSR